MALVTKKKKVPTANTSTTVIPTSKAPATTTSIATPSKTPKASVTAVKKKPSVPKEVKPIETPKKEQPPVQREERKSPEAQEPIAPSERKSEPARPKQPSAGTEKVSTEAMREMSLEARLKLFKSLNKNPEAFVGIRKELPKKMEMRKDEAILRGIIEKEVPKASKGMDINYCPYCIDWQPFVYHSWTGYTKCVSCGVSTMDYYTRTDNKLWGKDL